MPRVISVAEVMALMPTTEPMDRSMLPVIITKLCPMPISRYLDMDRNRFWMFMMENTLGFMMPKAT